MVQLHYTSSALGNSKPGVGVSSSPGCFMFVEDNLSIEGCGAPSIGLISEIGLARSCKTILLSIYTENKVLGVVNP